MLWIVFVIHFLFAIPSPLKRSYLFQCLHESRTYSLKLFSWRDNFFSIVAEIIWFAFCFRLNNFSSKISNLLLLLEGQGAGGRGPIWINNSALVVKTLILSNRTELFLLMDCFKNAPVKAPSKQQGGFCFVKEALLV